MPSALSGAMARAASRIHGRTALAAGGVALAVSLALWIPATGLLHPFMVDLDTYRLAAQDAHHNQANVYVKAYGTYSKGPFLYPPFALAILMQISSLSLHTLGWIFTAVSALSLFVTVYVLLRKLQSNWDAATTTGWTLGIGAAALWLEPVLRTFMFGQVSLILLALVVVDLTRPDHSRWKGVGIGLAIAIKLTPAVFVLYLLTTRRFRAALTAIGVFAATVVAGFVLLPHASSKFWFHSLAGPTQINKYITIGDATDQSLKAMLFRALHKSSLLNPAYDLLAAAVLIAGLYAATWLYKKGDDLGGMIVTSIAGLLVSPIAWTHHWVWVLPALLVLGHRVVTGIASGRLTAAAFGLATLAVLAYPMKLDPSGRWDISSKYTTWYPTSITWTQPHQNGREFHWNILNFLIGNLYVLIGVAAVATLAWRAWSRRAEVAGEPSAWAEGRAALAPVWAVVRRRPVFEPVAVGVGSAALLFGRLMFPKPVGVADNYDGGRLLCHFNLVQKISGSSVIQKYTWFQYIARPHNGCSQTQYLKKDLPHPAYESSQLVLMYIGKMATRFLSPGSVLDLRILGLVCCVFIGGAVALLFAVLRTRPVFRYVLVAGILLVTLDASFLDFAISPLSEISAVIGTLYLLPAVVLLVRGGRARRRGLLVGLAAGFFLTFSKAQMEILAIPVGLVLASFPLRARLGRVDLTGRIGRRVLPVGAGVLLLAGTVGLTPKQDAHYAVINKADFVFTSLLRVSPNPTGDLASLGIPASFDDQIGKEAWCATGKDADGNPTGHFIGSTPVRVADPTKPGKTMLAFHDDGSVHDPALAQGMSRGTVMKFLATHPDRAVRVMNDAAGDFFHVRPQFSVFCPSSPSKAAMNTDLGNYAADSGKAPGSVDPIAPVTAVFQLFEGLGLIPLLVLWLVPAAVAARLAVRRRRRAAGDTRALAVTTLLLSSIAVLQFLASAFGDGIDTAKHLNLSVYASALAVVTAAGAAVLARRGTVSDAALVAAGIPAAGETADAGAATDADGTDGSDSVVSSAGTDSTDSPANIDDADSADATENADDADDPAEPLAPSR